MAYFFNMLLIFSVLLFQTSIAPKIWPVYNFCNLMSLFVVYLVLYRPIKELIVFLILTGIMMDSVSGCPFGLYVTIYMWLAIGLKWALRFLYKGNVIFIPLALSILILSENLIAIFVMAIIEQYFIFDTEILRSIMVQMIYGVIIGPFLILLAKDLQEKWNIWSFEKISKNFR